MENSTTILQQRLRDMKSAGLPVYGAKRSLNASPSMRGSNALAYENWIGQWIANSYVNHDVIMNSLGVNFLKDSAKKIPAIVIGIGPSLDFAMDHLLYSQRNTVTIATDAAVRPLVANGIKPDLVINLDASERQETMWRTMDIKDLVLVMQSCTHPRTVNAWNGPKLFYNLRQDTSPFNTDVLPIAFPHIGEIDAAGTVGNMAVLLADMMGCSPIICVGMDFCYGELGDGRWRYRCTDYEHRMGNISEGTQSRWEPMENKVLYDNDERMKKALDHDVEGVIYKTDPDLLFYYDAFKRLVGQRNLWALDASGGMLKHIVRSAPLPKILDEHCHRELRPIETSVKWLKEILCTKR